MHHSLKDAGCSIDDLKEKEVINVCDGRRLGYICDLLIDVSCGQILSILVPGDMRVFSFKRPELICIPWCNIERIGDDTILVKPDFPLPHPRPPKKDSHH